MSFILDALKRSDAKRRLGQAPTLADAPPPVAIRRPLWRRLLPVIILLGVAFGLWRFWENSLWSELLRGGDEPVPPPAPLVSGDSTEPAEVQQTVASDEQPTRPSPGRPSAGAAPARGTGANRGGAGRPAPARDASTAADIATKEAMQSRQAREDLQRRLESNQVTEVTVGDEPVPTSDQAAAPLDDEVAAPIAQERRPSRVVVNQAARGGDDGLLAVPLIYQLPLRTRLDLPDMDLNVHFYAEEADSRFVLINMERFEEGDTIDEEVTLEEIRREGVVMTFRGERFLLEAR